MTTLIANTPCLCLCHANPLTWVPICPTHGHPLYAAEEGRGQCPWRGRPVARYVDGRQVTQRARCIVWGPQSWAWRHRGMFNAVDLPPLNGHEAPRIHPVPDGTWEVVSRHCPACDTTRQHVAGEHRAVCTSCGHHEWLSEPAYVD